MDHLKSGTMNIFPNKKLILFTDLTCEPITLTTFLKIHKEKINEKIICKQESNTKVWIRSL